MAKCSYCQAETELYDGGTPICIEVQVSRRVLTADEGQLSPRALVTLPKDEALYLSMRAGACKHFGAIPLTAILSIRDASGTLPREA